MPGLLGVLDMAGRGMSVATRGVTTAGHNIANADNPDYHRQRQILANELPTNQRGDWLGDGVRQVGIERVTDAFVELQLLRQSSSLGSADVQADALAQIEAVLNELDGDGLSVSLDALYRAFSDVAAATTPGAPAERSALVSAAQRMISTLQGHDAQLRDQLAATNQAISAVLPQVNELTRQIDELNGQIVAAEPIAAANDLRDMRDARLRDLSELVDITHFEESTGAIVVTLPNGLPLVEGGFARQLVAIPDTANTFDPRTPLVHYTDGSNSIDISTDIGGGKLGGLLRVRETTLPDAIRSIDTVAYNLVATVNSVHQLGTGLDGSVGDFFAPLTAVEDSARDIALAPAILASTDAIAAGLTSAAGDNRNALALAALRDTPSATFLPGDPPGPPSGPSQTLLDQISGLVSRVGEQARSMSASVGHQTRVLEDIETRRDEMSAVSIDEEVAHLVQLQAAFQANARVVSLVDGLLDDVLNLI